MPTEVGEMPCPQASWTSAVVRRRRSPEICCLARLTRRTFATPNSLTSGVAPWSHSIAMGAVAATEPGSSLGFLDVLGTNRYRKRRCAEGQCAVNESPIAPAQVHLQSSRPRLWRWWTPPAAGSQRWPASRGCPSHRSATGSGRLTHRPQVPRPRKNTLPSCRCAPELERRRFATAVRKGQSPTCRRRTRRTLRPGVQKSSPRRRGA